MRLLKVYVRHPPPVTSTWESGAPLAHALLRLYKNQVCIHVLAPLTPDKASWQHRRGDSACLSGCGPSFGPEAGLGAGECGDVRYLPPASLGCCCFSGPCRAFRAAPVQCCQVCPRERRTHGYALLRPGSQVGGLKMVAVNNQVAPEAQQLLLAAFLEAQAPRPISDLENATKTGSTTAAVELNRGSRTPIFPYSHFRVLLLSI